MKFTIKNGMKARYKLTVRDKQENILRESAWSDNVLTDNLFAVMGGGGQNVYFTGMVCGTGNAPALPTDTSLDSFLAVLSSRVSSTVEVNSTVSPRFIKRIVVDRFDAGFVGANPANISEVGMVVAPTYSGLPTSSSPLGSRSLVVDSGGSPTTVPVGVDEILDVTWEWVTYVAEDVVVSGVPLDNKGTPQFVQTTARACMANTGTTLTGAAPIHAQINNRNEVFNSAPVSTSQSGRPETRESPVLYDYAQTTATGASGGQNALDWVSYNPSTLTVSFVISSAVDSANFAGGVGKVITSEKCGGRWQIAFDPPIPKTSDDRLEIEWDIVFERL